MKELIKKYTDVGVKQEKIITTKQPSVVMWSTTRNCIVGGDTDIEPLEVLNENGDLVLTHKKNVFVSLLVRSELTKDDINEINNSKGIICTDALYGRDGFRYGFIPQ